VRDSGDEWQVVLQTDHAALAGQFAEAWGGEGFDPLRPRHQVVAATARHDDGWAVWERAPSLLSRDGAVEPRDFLDVQVLSHLALYRAQIAAVLDDDPYAGLLVSMHARGIYNHRNGTDPGLVLTFAGSEQRAVDAFVAEQEQLQAQLIDEHQIPEDERWANYKLLQIFDRLSLYFCMKDLQAGEPSTLAPVPIRYGSQDTTELKIEPDSAWRVRMDPFPFEGSEASFTVLRRTLPKRSWSDVEEFRREFFDNPPQEQPIVIAAA